MGREDNYFRRYPTSSCGSSKGSEVVIKRSGLEIFIKPLHSKLYSTPAMCRNCQAMVSIPDEMDFLGCTEIAEDL